jgi:enamine deaminase RidA (YjgF/YER057c/UK114 family)
MKGEPMLPYAETITAGDFVFTAGLVSPDVGEPCPLHEFPVRRQARGIYGALGETLAGHGTALGNTVSLIQFFRGRGQTAAYIGERRKFFQDGVPTSTGIGCTDLLTPDTVLQVDGIVAIPREGMTVAHHAGASGKAGYSHAVSFGDWVFCSGITPSAPQSTAVYPGALGTTLPAEIRVDPNYWFGLLVQPQTLHIMENKLKPVLADVGLSLQDVAYAHIHLEDPSADLAAFVETWNAFYQGRPPLTVISPSNGLGSVGATIEITPFAVRPGGRVAIEDIAVEGLAPFAGLGPLARRVGDLVFTSTIAAVDGSGLLPEARPDGLGARLFSQTGREVEIILDRIARICQAAGGTLEDVVKLRLYLSSMADLPAAYAPIRERLGSRVALSAVETARTAGWIPGATVSVDAVAHRPRS